jgi:hypothetical protein
MRRTGIAGALCLAAAFAAFGWPGGANAAVIIKTFHVTICVTGEKHPDGCKNVAADGRVVVSDDAMEWLDGKTGEAATIEAVGAKATSSSGQAHRRHRQDAPQ